MFSNLKEKILDLSKSVYFLSTDSSDASEPIDLDVNLQAGSEILSYYRKHWFELREISEENAKSAEKVANVIDKIEARVATHHQNITMIIDNLMSGGPNMKESVSTCLTQMKELRKSFENTEKAICMLEDLIEKHELVRKKSEHQQQLELYKEKKMENLEMKRNEFANAYAKNCKKSELMEKKLMEEKQKIYQKAFERDLEIAKLQGIPPQISTSKSVQPSALLEEIQLDLDKKELDAFLDDSTEKKE